MFKVSTRRKRISMLGRFSSFSKTIRKRALIPTFSATFSWSICIYTVFFEDKPHVGNIYFFCFSHYQFTSNTILQFRYRGVNILRVRNNAKYEKRAIQSNIIFNKCKKIYRQLCYSDFTEAKLSFFIYA